MNWLMKYPSDPMISTPSYPASRASDAQRTKARIWRSIPRSLSARGREWRDRRLQARGRDGQRVIAVPARVQDLQRDVAALGVHGSRDRPVPCGGSARREAAGEGRSPAFDVRREPAGHDQADAAARTLRKIGLEAREFLRVVLESGVHRAHQDAIAQLHEAEVEGCEQVRIGRVHEPQLKLSWSLRGSCTAPRQRMKRPR